MASLREKVEAELQNVDDAVRDLPRSERLHDLSPLELAGTAALVASFYNGLVNILKQMLLARRAAERGALSVATRDQLAPFLAFRHFFSQAYGFDLDADRLQPLVRDLAKVYGSFRKEWAGAIPGSKGRR